jgi:MscS family membrane protein
LTGFLATAGVASLAIAFGAQETFANVISGISILVDRSIHVGERVELRDGLIGDVLEIGLRSTRIMSLDQRLIIVPNKEIAGTRLINWSQPDTATKIKLKIGVASDENLERVKQIVLDVCAKEGMLSKKSPASVVCTGFGPYYIELLIVATVDDCRTGGAATDKLVVGLQEAFRLEKVALPFPVQQILLQK